MKFKYILLALIATVSLKVTAQTTPPPSKTKDADSYVQSYIGFFGGISSPLRDFKSTDYSNNKAGFASRSVTFGLDGAVYVYRNLAIGGTISFQDQGQLTQDNITAIATGYAESFKADVATASVTGRFHSYNFLIGPQYSIPVFKSFIIDLRAFGGALTTTTTPEYTISGLTGSTTQTAAFYQRSAKGTSLSYGGSAAVRYKLSDGVHVVLKGTYINSEGPKITTDNLSYFNGRYVTRQPFTAFQTTLGLNFSF